MELLRTLMQKIRTARKPIDSTGSAFAEEVNVDLLRRTYFLEQKLQRFNQINLSLEAQITALKAVIATQEEQLQLLSNSNAQSSSLGQKEVRTLDFVETTHSIDQDSNANLESRDNNSEAST